MTAPPGRVDSSFAPGGMIPGGKRYFFRSAERLASDDGNGFIDVYVRDLVGKRTTLVSKGDPSCAGEGCGSGSFAAVFTSASVNGTKAFLATDEKLTAGNKDTFFDICRNNVGSGEADLVCAPLDCPSLTSASPMAAPRRRLAHLLRDERRPRPRKDDSSQDVYESSVGSKRSSRSAHGNGPDAATFAGAYLGWRHDLL